MMHEKLRWKGKLFLILTTVAALTMLSACGAGEDTEVAGPGNGTEQNDAGVREEAIDTRRPEEIYRFESSALHEPGAETINPDGMPLNIGCEDCQDIYYASRSYTVEEAADIVREKFGVSQMIQDENFIRFDLHLDEVRDLELELDLIAAKKLDSPNEIIDIRITSIKPDEE